MAQKLATLSEAMASVADGRLHLESIHPYSSAEEVKSRRAFPWRPGGVPMTPAPSAEELAALAEVDPQRVRLVDFQA